MKKIVLFVLMMLPGLAIGFPKQTNTATVTLGANSGPDFRQWRFKIEGWSDQFFDFKINGLDSYNVGFKVSRTISSTNQTTYISLQPANLTATATNVYFSIARTNVPPNGVYKSELVFWDAATNLFRTAGRGTIQVTDSLYDTADETFRDTTTGLAGTAQYESDALG